MQADIGPFRVGLLAGVSHPTFGLNSLIDNVSRPFFPVNTQHKDCRRILQ